MKAFKLAIPVAVAALITGGAAQAFTLLDSSTYPTLLGTSGATVASTGVTFAAVGGPGAVFTQGSNAGFSGLGVSGGPTNTELDIGEKITMSWNYFAALTSFSVALLYNGPEFNDVAEIAQVKAFYEDGYVVGTLAVDATGNLDVARWTTTSGTVDATTDSPANADSGGAFSVQNPFGNLAINRLEFSAIPGVIGAGGGTSVNDSDYVLSSVNVVPEPGTYALLLAGLGAIGFVARRRRLPS